MNPGFHSYGSAFLLPSQWHRPYLLSGPKVTVFVKSLCTRLRTHCCFAGGDPNNHRVSAVPAGLSRRAPHERVAARRALIDEDKAISPIPAHQVVVLQAADHARNVIGLDGQFDNNSVPIGGIDQSSQRRARAPFRALFRKNVVEIHDEAPEVFRHAKKCRNVDAV